MPKQTVLVEPLYEREPSLPCLLAPISIVSGSRVVREGLAALLICLGEAEVAACLPREPFPEPPRHPTPGQIVVLDGAVQVGPALDWIRACRSANPLAQVMVIELVDSVEPLLAYAREGVRGYILRGAPIAEIVNGLQALRQGDAYCSPALTGRLFEHLNRPAQAQPPPLPAGLSARELEVLRYLTLDYSNQQIADQLVIDVRTVKHHVHNILQKLKVRHRWDAARLAQSEDWPAVGGR